eukprot:m51a1_g4897 putative amsh-like ubiquitin thioesterase 1-like (422) ;mRNA; f:130271-132176
MLAESVDALIKAYVLPFVPAVSSATRIEIYYRSLRQCALQAETYALDANSELYMRMKSHKSFVLPAFQKQRSDATKTAVEVIGKLEAIKPSLEQLYEDSRAFSCASASSSQFLDLPAAPQPSQPLQQPSGEPQPLRDPSAPGGFLALGTVVSGAAGQAPQLYDQSRLAYDQRPSPPASPPRTRPAAAAAATSRGPGAWQSQRAAAVQGSRIDPRVRRGGVLKEPAPGSAEEAALKAFCFEPETDPLSRAVVVGPGLIESFAERAHANTSRGIETCGILAGKISGDALVVTTCIIPRQEATSDTCNMLDEEKLFEYQDAHSLITIGWIHTHPTQSLFMSSIDLHTQYPYQQLLPEAIAIVVAPLFSPNFGIFSLTKAGLREMAACTKRGFHPHKGPLYCEAANVEIKHQPDFEVIDMRGRQF